MGKDGVRLQVKQSGQQKISAKQIIVDVHADVNWFFIEK